MRNRTPAKQVVVLGMHRSGTSLVANLVDHAGIVVGEDLLEASASNLDGHFEDRELVALNEKVLNSSGYRWDAPPSYEEAAALAGRYGAAYRDYAARRGDQAPGWAVKDPRLSLTVAGLHPFLSRPYYVVCSRSPEAVADSLARREGFSPDFSHQLQATYEQCIESFLRAHPELPVHRIRYEALMDSPREPIAALYDFLEVPGAGQLLGDAVAKVRSRDNIREATLRQLKAARDAQLAKLKRNPLRLLTPAFWKRLIKLQRRYARQRDGSVTPGNRN